ncbi:MAG TPA: tetratricopeptide repeat protein, partial [Acidobacteriota bacterium]|nr:tetratricopeptide repeat protein [Acidobacteriota bacterium]
MRQNSFKVSSVLTRFERSFAKELELVAGLHHLSQSSRAQSVLFHSDSGSGKSTLLSQIDVQLTEKGARVVSHKASSETRPYASCRRWISEIMEKTAPSEKKSTASLLGKKITNPGSNVSLADFSDFIRTLYSDRFTAFLVDDVQNFDEASRKLLIEFLHSFEDRLAMFVFTSTGRPFLNSQTISIPLEILGKTECVNSLVVPLWKPEQMRRYLHQIYDLTGGNPMLILRLMDEMGTRPESVVWDNAEWTLDHQTVASLPGNIAAHYIGQLPDLSTAEKDFLEMASIQGVEFKPEWISQDSTVRIETVESLANKEIIAGAGGQFRFRKSSLAHTFYAAIPEPRRRELHRELALRIRSDPTSPPARIVAHHLSRASDFRGAFACVLDEIERGIPAAARELLPILEEMENGVEHLDASQCYLMFKARAELQLKRGNYLAALKSFEKAKSFAGEDVQREFAIEVGMAQTLLMGNDILSALKILGESAKKLARIEEPNLLMRFYFARGVCSWHRGQRDKSDFQAAVAIAEKLEDYESLAVSFRQRAEMIAREGPLAEARLLARKTLRYAQRCRNHNEAGHALKILGSISWRLSQYPAALRHLKRAMRQFHWAQNNHGLGLVWNILGNVQMDRFQFTQAVAAYRNALMLFNEVDHPMEHSLARFSLGRVLIEQGDLQEADAIFVRCSDMDRKAGNKHDYAYDLRARAVVAVLRGHHKKAGRLLKRVIEICEELEAENDILQTKLLMMHNELEQQNAKAAQQ